MRLMLEGNLGEIVAKYHVYKFPKWRKTLFLLLLLACKPSYGWHMLGCPTGPTKALGDYPENFVTEPHTILRLLYTDEVKTIK